MRAEGRAAADASSCLEVWRGQRLSTAWQAAEEISAFHQKDGSGWMACDKRCYWIFGDFHKLVATAQADCNAFTIYISFPTLYFQQKVWFWKEDNVFFQASFACQALLMELQSVAAREENPNLVLEGISSLPWNCPGEHPQGDGVQAMTKLCSRWPNLPVGL